MSSAIESKGGVLVDDTADVEAASSHHVHLAQKQCMLENLRRLMKMRESNELIARDKVEAALRNIRWRAAGPGEKHLGEDRRQCGPDGKPAESLEALYEVAELARVVYSEVITDACTGGAAEIIVAPLKGRDRAGAKARVEYEGKMPPCYSWIFDVVRGSVLCETSDDIVRLYQALEADQRVDIVRTKNRFSPPLVNGYRDLLLNVAVRVATGDGTEVSHICELQIHLRAIEDSQREHGNHLMYEYFRKFFITELFAGNEDTAKKCLNMHYALPPDVAATASALVDRVLGSDVMIEDLRQGIFDLFTILSEHDRAEAPTPQRP